MTFQIELDENYNLMKVTPGFNYDLKISNAFIYKHISSTSSGIVYRSVHCDSGIDPLYILLICLAAIVIVIFFFVGCILSRSTSDQFAQEKRVKFAKVGIGT